MSSRTWLRCEYHDKGRTQQDIARELGCSQQTVLRSLKKYGIPARSVGRAKRIDETMSDVASQFTRITDELVAQLLIDMDRHQKAEKRKGINEDGVADLTVIGKNVRAVEEAHREPSEWWATSRFLIELAASALLCAMKKRAGKTFDREDDAIDLDRVSIDR